MQTVCLKMLPTIESLLPVLFDEGQCKRFLVQQGIFYTSLPCPKCGDHMQANEDIDLFRCSKRSCRTSLSIRSHTFFAGSRLKSCQIMHLGYLWLNKNSQTQAMNATGCSSKTVTDFFCHFRALVATVLEEEDTRIGGPGVLVEIDETKLGKRKYHRGHRVDGVWILVGVEKTESRRVFLKRVVDRSAETLEGIIEQHVEVGSIVTTDMWRGYSKLTNNLGLEHRTVNHSLHFKDPDTGSNTNTVEGTNNALKIQIRPRNRTWQVEEHLSEFVWRRKHGNRLWTAYIEALKEVHYSI